MKAYTIDVTQVEELQKTRDTNELDRIFARAKSTIVNGEKVNLVRRGYGSAAEKFDEITTLEDLESVRERVFRYL
ncbi:MAG TPA: hypothetical protein VFZ78_11410 [Flavisolibacter sp.]